MVFGSLTGSRLSYKEYSLLIDVNKNPFHAEYEPASSSSAAGNRYSADHVNRVRYLQNLFIIDTTAALWKWCISICNSGRSVIFS